MILTETLIKHLPDVRPCARHLKLWKLEWSPRLVELTFERAKASDNDNVDKSGTGYGECAWFFSALLVPFRDRGPGSGGRTESRMKLFPPPPPQPAHLLLCILEIPPPKSFPISHFSPSSHHPHPGCHKHLLSAVPASSLVPIPILFSPGQPEPSFQPASLTRPLSSCKPCQSSTCL